MSFSKAKRFDYKIPEITVSPADYYITTSLDKSITINKCPRFSQKSNSEPGTSFNWHVSCSSPLNITKKSNTTNSIETISNRSSSCNQLTFPKKPQSQKNRSLTETRPHVKELIGNFENLAKRCEIISSQEFFDDDYFSYASSEELDHLKKVEEYEFNEVRRAYDEMRKKRSEVKSVVLRKLEGIEGELKRFRQDFGNIRERLRRIEDLQTEHKIDMENLEAMSRMGVGLSRERKSEIADIIAKAINYLNCEFENRKLKLLQRNEKQLVGMLREMQKTHDAAAGEMKGICEKTAESLAKELVRVFAEVDAPSGPVVEERLNGCFNYENVCKLLSEQLQITKDEIEILEQDSLDITVKYNTAQDALECQTSFIEQLQDEIATLKKEVDIEAVKDDAN